jgi:hypothetical protein
MNNENQVLSPKKMGSYPNQHGHVDGKHDFLNREIFAPP